MISYKNSELNLEGALDITNKCLSRLRYSPSNDYHGLVYEVRLYFTHVTLVCFLEDIAITVSNSVGSATRYISTKVVSIDDPPSISVTGSHIGFAGTTFRVQGIQVQYPDIENRLANITLCLNSNHEEDRLFLPQKGGLNFDAANTWMEPSFMETSFSATIDNINNALR